MGVRLRLACACCFLLALAAGCGGEPAPPPVDQEEIVNETPRTEPQSPSGREVPVGEEKTLPDKWRD